MHSKFARATLGVLTALSSGAYAACRKPALTLARDSGAAVSDSVRSTGTKLGSFKPEAGVIVTVGYTDVGTVGSLGEAEVEAREVRASDGTALRGLSVEVTRDQYNHDKSFVDADEIPELLHGIDSVLAVRSNPTSLKNFEVRYRTRGNLGITAFSWHQKDIKYAVTAGSVTQVMAFLDVNEMHQFRNFVVTANTLLTHTPVSASQTQ
jgi:hypothetical protein